MSQALVSKNSRPTYSTRSAAAFTHLIEDIGRAIEPTAVQLDSLARSYRSTAEFLAARPEFQGLLIDIHPQGSRELGTITRPIDPNRDDFDVDLVAGFAGSALTKYSDANGPQRLLKE